MSWRNAKAPLEPELGNGGSEAATDACAAAIASALASIRALQSLVPPVIEAVAQRLTAKQLGPGDVVCAEGDPADQLFVLACGSADAARLRDGRPEPLWTLNAGEAFGEEALAPHGSAYGATITARTPVTVLGVSRATIEHLSGAHPTVRAAFAALAEELQTLAFLKQATPFSGLSLDQLRSLLDHAGWISRPAGADIVRQGEAAAACYLLRSGQAEVWLDEEGEKPRKLATLRPGTLIGERGLLTGEPRNATVRAATPCDLLELSRDDLTRHLCGDARSARELVQMLQMRDRPCAVEGVEAHQTVGPDGAPQVVLKNTRDHTYFRLSDEGWFLWQRMDGRHTIRDLMLDYMITYQAFGPEPIAQLAAALTHAGFLRSHSLRPELAQAALGASARDRILMLAHRLLTWQVSVGGIGSYVDALYRAGFGLLYRRRAAPFLAVVVTGGLWALVAAAPSARAAIRNGFDPRWYWLAIPAYLFSVLLHEAAHALGVRACGREVSRGGIGWHWISPIAFVDTSDMWLADKWARIRVSAAGPCANALAGGAAALAALLVGGQTGALLWLFALLSFALVLFNLNPLLDYDGYYILEDLLERAGLRRAARAWLRTSLGRTGRPWLRNRLGGTADPASQSHSAEQTYVAFAVAFVLIATASAAALWRFFTSP